MRVIRRSEDLVSIDGDVSLDASTFVSTSAGRPLRETRDGGLFCATATRGGCACLRHLGAILPDQVSSYAVQRLNNATRVRQVHDAVVDEWCRLIRTRIIHRPRPGELKLLHVLPVDLVERAVAPCVIRAPPVQPVAWSRIAQHGLGDGPEVFHLRHEPEAPQEHHD